MSGTTEIPAGAFSGRHAVVSGGAGFVGSHLSDQLLKLGATVTVLDNEMTGDPANLTAALKTGRLAYKRHDITVPLPELNAPVHFVFNLASPASPVHYAKWAVETLRTGSLGTENLLQLAVREKAVFLQASTSEVYGDPQVHPQPESYWGHVNPVGPRSMYDEAKRYAEALSTAYESKRGANVRIARIFNTYGTRMQMDDGRVVPNLICQALRNEPLTVYGDGRQTRSFCYVSDLVDGLLRLSLSDVRGPVNLGTPFEKTITEFALLIRALVGTKSEVVYRPLPKDDPLQRQPDLTRARNLLGWNPHVPLDTGLKLTIEDFRRRLSPV